MRGPEPTITERSAKREYLNQKQSKNKNTNTTVNVNRACKSVRDVIFILQLYVRSEDDHKGANEGLILDVSCDCV